MSHRVPSPPSVKAFAAPYARFDPRTGVVLLLFCSLVRFALVLQANVTRSYQVVVVIFLLMLALPFLLLTRAGRAQIGLVAPGRWRGVLLGGGFGVLSCSVLYYVTRFFFGVGPGNSLAYIATTYAQLPRVLTAENRLLYFLLFSGPSLVFSPIGEEVFYRGLVHECFAARLGQWQASLVDSTAFALVHLAHFGLVYTAGQWQFLPGPALVWVVSLFGTCLLFSLARTRSGSLVGAMVAHAGFNLTMNYFIFYHLL